MSNRTEWRLLEVMCFPGRRPKVEGNAIVLVKDIGFTKGSDRGVPPWNLTEAGGKSLIRTVGVLFSPRARLLLIGRGALFQTKNEIHLARNPVLRGGLMPGLCVALIQGFCMRAYGVFESTESSPGAITLHS